MRSRRRGAQEGEVRPEALTIDYHPEAVAELVEAAQFYEERRVGFGARFLTAVESAQIRILDNPFIGRIDLEGARRLSVPRFPCLLNYRQKGKQIIILAVAHTSRKPGYWVARTDEE